MAKKNQTTKKTKIEISETSATQTTVQNSEVIENTIPTTVINGSTVISNSISGHTDTSDICTKVTKMIEETGIENLMWLEKACALVCKRYETMSRLDGSSNTKFKLFSSYYADILNELEKRVEYACQYHN